MTTTFTSLCADDVYVAFKAFCDVLWMANHVHVEDAVFVQFIDNMLRWYTDSRDKEFGTRIDDDIDEFIELALGVIVATKDTSISPVHSVDSLVLTLFSVPCLQPVGSRDQHQTVHSCPSGSF